MNCPNCTYEMNVNTDQDITIEKHLFWNKKIVKNIYTHTCPYCNIVFKQKENSLGSWLIPQTLLPSQKQVQYANNIIKYLGCKTINPLLTKKNYQDFISQHNTEFKALAATW